MKTRMQPEDQRRTWRQQEDRLVERWKAACVRCDEAAGQIALQGDQPSEAMLTEAAAARSELESTKKQLARIKSEFREGKRY